MMNRDYNDPQYKQYRKLIRKRDNNTCQWPHCKQKNKLHVHHIKKWAEFPGLRYHPHNGILLCKIHHNYIKNNEDAYCSFFTSIIMNKLKNNL